MTSSSCFFGISCFWGSSIPEKTWWWFHHHVFQVFVVFWVEESIKSMHFGYSLDAEFNFASNEPSRLKCEEKHRKICRKYEQKVVFFFLPPKLINIIFLGRPILDLKFPLMVTPLWIGNSKEWFPSFIHLVHHTYSQPTFRRVTSWFFLVNMRIFF